MRRELVCDRCLLVVGSCGLAKTCTLPIQFTEGQDRGISLADVGADATPLSSEFPSRTVLNNPARVEYALTRSSNALAQFSELVRWAKAKIRRGQDGAQALRAPG